MFTEGYLNSLFSYVPLHFPIVAVIDDHYLIRVSKGITKEYHGMSCIDI